jgi:hypothetical protein
MKKIKLILVFVIFLSNLSFGQTVDGITLGKTEKEVTSKLISKGFKLIDVVSKTTKRYKGKLSNGDDVIINILSTPKTKLVWKLIIKTYAYSWPSAKSTFDNYKAKLVNKYGDSTIDNHYFTTPYFEGDGYEMLALYKDNCTWSSSWYSPLIRIEINSFKYDVAEIWISYQNEEASEINNIEKAEIDNKTF